MYCTNCGAEIKQGDRFCSACGRPVEQPRENRNDQADSSQPAGVPMKYADFWKRFVAMIIDNAIISFATGIIFAGGIIKSFPGMMHRFMWGDGEHAFEWSPSFVGDILAMIGMIFGFWLISTIGSWLYFALMESSNYQGTVGKMALGIKVTGTDGLKISFGRATGRYFAKWVSAMTLLIGYLMAAFTEKRQALHDIMADTLVLDK